MAVVEPLPPPNSNDDGDDSRVRTDFGGGLSGDLGGGGGVGLGNNSRPRSQDHRLSGSPRNNRPPAVGETWARVGGTGGASCCGGGGADGVAGSTCWDS